MNRVLYTKLLYFFFLISFAQAKDVEITTSIDTNNILIGDWIQYNIKIVKDTNTVVQWPIFEDTSGKIETIEISILDTVKKGDLITLSQSVTITSFDSGYYILPPLLVISSLNNKIDSSYSQTLMFSVSPVAADTTQNLKPIKAPLNTPLSFAEIWPYLLIALIVLIIIVALIWWYRKFKNRDTVLVEKVIPREAPHVIALAKLKKLEEGKLWQEGAVKTYYSSLSEIIREYIEYRFHQLALESTTDEIIYSLKKGDLNSEILEQLKAILSLSDLVKFAKAKPLPDEHVKVLQAAYDFINKTKEVMADANNSEEVAK